MKNSLFYIILMMGFIQCTKKVTQWTLKDDRSVEDIHIGMPIAQALKILDKRYFVEKQKVSVLDDEPAFTEYVVYADKSKKVLRFTFNGGQTKKTSENVFRIVLRNSAYKTAEGVYVGMAVRDLKAKAALKSADFNFQDGLYIISGKFDGGYWMDLDPKKDYKSNYDRPALKDIPENLKIKGIVIF